MTDEPAAVSHRNRQGDAAVVLVHGTPADAAATFGRFPELLIADPVLASWDVHSIGYPASLSFDMTGSWSDRPDVILQGGSLGTLLSLEPFDRYKSLALIAHSLGGLLVQRALLSSSPLCNRVSHVFLYATPSDGVDRASPFNFWKRQARDLARESPFIRSLRSEWNARFGENPPFMLLAIAGDRDEFVPATSSLFAFPESARHVVHGTHADVARPANREQLNFRLAAQVLGGARKVTPDIVELARLALESRDFEQVIKLLWRNEEQHKLDTNGRLTLALALDSAGRRDDAIGILTAVKTTDAATLGTLAGRLKRRWFAERRKSDAEQAFSLYLRVLDEAAAAGDDRKALYGAINCAFMILAAQGDSTACRSYAERALRHCENVSPDVWSRATQAEASIYLGNIDAARDAYTQALSLGPTAEQAEVIYQQGVRAADLVGEDEFGTALRTLFGIVAVATAPGTLYLESIDLKNIRCFAELTVSFVHGGTLRTRAMILGDNAFGKSTLLRAIALGLCNESDAIGLINAMPGPVLRTGTSDGSITVHLVSPASGQRVTLTKRISRDTDGSETVRQTAIPAEVPWESLFVCGYGTQRTSMATASLDAYSPGAAVATLFDPRAVLQNPELALLRQQPGLRRQLMKQMLEIMLLDAGSDIIEESAQGLRLRGPFGVVPFAVLSDGYRSTAQWLMDLSAWAILAGRLPADGAPAGILLVDEIEQHLHPRWQRHIVQRLAAQLPAMQIIATTHTPLVASGMADVDDSCLLRFRADQEGGSAIEFIEPARLHGKRADQVLTDIFDLVTSRNARSSKDLEEVVRLRGIVHRSAEEDAELAALSARVKDALEFGDNPAERKVRTAVSAALDQVLRQPPDEALDVETARQLRELFADSPDT